MKGMIPGPKAPMKEGNDPKFLGPKEGREGLGAQGANKERDRMQDVRALNPLGVLCEPGNSNRRLHLYLRHIGSIGQPAGQGA